MKFQTFCLLCLLTLFTATSFAQDYTPRELIIQWKPSLSTVDQEALKQQMTATTSKKLPGTRLEVLQIGREEERTIPQLVETYKNHPAVDFVEPNYIYSIGATPNDPLFANLWGMHNTGQSGGTPDADIDAPEAWDISTSASSMVVAIIDTGIDWGHEDLVDNIWQNLGEDADGDGQVLEWNGSQWVFDPGDENGIDDDGNGYADDFVGWDFRNNDNNPYDGHYHGTHVAGTVGAKGNNDIGVAGVCWDVQLAALKFLSDGGGGSTSDAVEAVNYAVMMGIPISNNSWGGGGYSTALYNAIQNGANNGHLFLAAAGNSNNNNDANPYYPASYTNDNVITVASTTRTDSKSSFSSYGATSVDLGAPGSSILSCFPNNAYNTISGTSMATPHVAGACALLWANNPSKTYTEIKDAILNSTNPIAAMNGITVSGGRLNLHNALTYFTPPPSGCRYTDSLALVALYNSTDGANWTNTWDLNQPMNTWYGVTLNGDECVVELDLDNNLLVGTLSAELGNLLNLEKLRLNYNQLSGSIPPELGDLSNLEGLYMYANQLSGSIPPELGDLSNLTALALFSNQLSGNIPAELGNLSNLITLILESNQLNGSIASELGNLSNLKKLSLSGNQLSGNIPVELGNLMSLEELWLHGNQLSGSIPVELGNLPNLAHLYLHTNQLSGSIPSELGNLSNLIYLYLHNNQLSGCFPPELSAHCGINYNFSNNPGLPGGGDFAAFCANGTGACSANSCATSDSLALVALYNSTDGANWTDTWDLNQPMSTWYGVTLNGDGCVEEVNLYFNNVVGNLPSELGTLDALITLSLGNNQLSGTIPTSLGDLQNLENLYLLGNQLTGAIPSSLGNLSDLKSLYLQANDLNGAIPSEIGNLDSLEYLHLSGNQLSGQIPASLGNLSNLTLLMLANNNLSGCFPPELSVHCGISYSFSNNPGLPGGGNFVAFCTSGAGSCGVPVWPGDFNNDGVADNTDALYWGQAFGNTGAVRPSATTNWEAQDCPDWTQTVNGVNGKHQDGDGDSTVNTPDLQVLIDNYGNTHTTSTSTLSYNGVNYTLESIGYQGNATYRFALSVEQDGMPASIHGAACDIDFGDLSVSDATIDVSASSLVPGAHLAVFDATTNKLDLALTRTDGTNRTCNGPVLTMDIIIDDDLPLGGVVSFEIETGAVMYADESIEATGSSTFVSTLSEVGPSSSSMAVTLVVENQQCTTTGKASLQINGGVPPYTMAWSTGQVETTSATTVELLGLLAGEYSVTVTDVNMLMQSYDFEVAEQLLPIYDENGDPIPCGITCTPVLNLSGTASSGVFHASEALRSNSIIIDGSTTTYKAGNCIDLQPGFEVGVGATFSGEIEVCTPE